MGNNHSGYNHSVYGSCCCGVDRMGFGFHSAAPASYCGTFRRLRTGVRLFLILPKTIAKTCLSETTIKLLKEYLFTFPREDNPYVFASNSGYISPPTVNSRLRDLARDSGIIICNKKLHWHCFRKMVISQAKNLGIDPDIIKIMTGKSINKSILAYMTDVNIKEAFKKIQKETAVNDILMKPDAGDKIAKLEQTMEHLERENYMFKTRINSLQETTKKHIGNRGIKRFLLNEIG